MRFFKFYSLPLVACLAVALVFPACRNNSNDEPAAVGKLVSEYKYNVVRDWNELMFEVERYAAGYRPGPAPAPWPISVWPTTKPV